MVVSEGNNDREDSPRIVSKTRKKDLYGGLGGALKVPMPIWAMHIVLWMAIGGRTMSVPVLVVAAR